MPINYFPVPRDRADRRIWLLAKALEHAPLAEALALAQAAEDFVTTAAGEATHRLAPTIHRMSTRIH
jgi:hypothetical protein